MSSGSTSSSLKSNQLFNCKKYYVDTLKPSWNEEELKLNTGKWCAVFGYYIDRPTSSHNPASTLNHHVEYYLSKDHGSVWSWIVARSPDYQGVKPLPGKETYGYAMGLFNGTNGKYMTLVGKEDCIERPRIRRYKRPS
jgi:hypothetical protein